MTQAAIRKLVADSVVAALEAQAATVANADNTNRNIEESETHVPRRCTDKAKPTRKTIKTRKTRTQEQKSAQKAGRKLSKSNYGQAYSQKWSTHKKTNP
ncbi:hypothetical protein Tco_1529719 [Tanacetum coccineum]